MGNLENCLQRFRNQIFDSCWTLIERFAEPNRKSAHSTHIIPKGRSAVARRMPGQWSRWPAGPYLIESRSDHKLLGGTGLGFETPSRAVTGYVLARDAWGNGYATEALTAIVNIAEGLGVVRLYALCHPDHPASARVLEKCGFRLEQRLDNPQSFRI